MATPPASQPAAILVLGGTGTVGSRVVRQLSGLSDCLILVASRNGEEARIAPLPPPATTTTTTTTPTPTTTTSPTRPAPVAQQDDSNASNTGSSRLRHVLFDWFRRETWDNPFAAVAVGAVYLVAPPTLDADGLMAAFVDFARERGARRFVLQSASSLEPGGPAMGRVHGYLRELGRRGEVDWAVLRPSWFQQNFVDQPSHLAGIRDESKIYSATGHGKIPWVSADDIAAVAARALTAAEPPNTDYLILGPELLSYNEIANILTDVLGRRIVHVDLSVKELKKRHQAFGMAEEYANMLSAMDTAIKFGAEDRTNDMILALTGAAPRKFRDFAESVKEVWGAGR